MLMEAMQRVRAAEDAARQRRKETEQECAQILRTAQEELAREENVLRATLQRRWCLDVDRDYGTCVVCGGAAGV